MLDPIALIPITDGELQRDIEMLDATIARLSGHEPYRGDQEKQRQCALCSLTKLRDARVATLAHKMRKEGNGL